MQNDNINAAAAALGRLGGSKTSPAKRDASRANSRAFWQSPAGLARRAAMRKTEPAKADAPDNDDPANETPNVNAP